MLSALNRPRIGFVSLFVSSFLLIAPAAAQTPHGLKTHFRLVNSMSGQTSPGEWWGGDGWATAGALVTHGVNNVSSPLGMYSNADFTAIADYGLLRFYGFGSAESVAPYGLFLWVDDWIGAEPRAQYRDRLYVTSATLPTGTPVVVQFQLALNGSTTIVDTNPSASVSASFTATHTGPDLSLSLPGTPGVTSGLLDTAVGDSIDVHGVLRVYLHATGMQQAGPRTASISADVTAQVGATPLTSGVSLTSSSDPVVPAPEAASQLLVFEAARPNPFNPSTTLPLIMAGSSHVELIMFDVRGRRVRLLYDGWFEQGRHEITWDGRDDQGHVVASGSYIARAVTADGSADTRRLLLVK